MPAAPTSKEVEHIALAWRCLEAATRAMGDAQELALLEVKTMCWQDIRDWFPSAHAMTFAEARAIIEIKKGIEKKLIIGLDNNTFHYSRDPSGCDRGREAAYDLGQKLMRWNKLIEDRLFDRLFKRRGPLHSEKVLVVLNAAAKAHCAWWERHLEATDLEHG